MNHFRNDTINKLKYNGYVVLFVLFLHELSRMNEDKANELRKFGERIRLIRLSKGMTQTALADQMGKDQQSIQRLENGGMNPTYYYLLELSKGLEVNIKELFPTEE